MRSCRIVCAALLAVMCAAPAVAQNPVTAYPNNYRMLLNNTWVAILRVHYGPHETIGVHDHSSYSTVYVYLNDSGTVRFTHEEAKPFVLDRPPTQAGAFRVSPGRLERHAVENLSDKPSDFLRVELKHLAAGSLPAEFRGTAPRKPFVDGTTVVYDNPALRIERTLCDGVKPCNIAAEATPSVLVAIPDAPVKAAALHATMTMQNPAAWLAEDTATTVSSTAPFEVLRIVLTH